MGMFENCWPELFRQMELPLTSSAAAFPVRTSAKQESAPALTANAADYGRNTLGSFAKFDPASSSWKTSQPCLVEGSAGFSVTWPRSGMMRNGIALELTPLVRHSTANVSGYWHTPTTRDYKGQSGKGNRVRRGRGGRLHIANLCDQVVDTGRQDLVRSPTFREWLMGLPIGWTDLKPSETP